MKGRLSRLGEPALVMLAVVCLGARAIAFLRAAWAFRTDDAYITSRYALHWANGDGLLWNVGQPPVEGYSNFSLVVIESAAIKFGLDPFGAARWVCVVSLAVVCVFIYALSRRWLGRAASLAPVAMVLSQYGTYLWTVSGLETTLNEALVLGAVFAAGASSSPRRAAIGGVLAAFAGMTRPESPLVFAVLWLALAIDYAGTRDRDRLNRLLALTAGFVAVFLPYFAWRWHYFGRLLPNTAYCKAAWGGDPFAVVRELWKAARWLVPFALIAPFWRRSTLPLLIIAVVYAAVFIGVDPIVGYHNRHLLGAFALIAVCSAVGLSSVLRRVPSPVDGMLILTAALVFHVCWTANMASGLSNWAGEYSPRMAARQSVGRWLNDHLTPSDWVVLGDAGMISYVAHEHVLDAFCLNSREMTSPPIDFSPDRFVDLIEQMAPAAIIVISTAPDRLTINPVDVTGLEAVFVKLLDRPSFRTDYSLATVIGPHTGNFHYFIFTRQPVH